MAGIEQQQATAGFAHLETVVNIATLVLRVLLGISLVGFGLMEIVALLADAPATDGHLTRAGIYFAGFGLAVYAASRAVTDATELARGMGVPPFLLGVAFNLVNLAIVAWLIGATRGRAPMAVPAA